MPMMIRDMKICIRSSTNNKRDKLLMRGLDHQWQSYITKAREKELDVLKMKASPQYIEIFEAKFLP